MNTEEKISVLFQTEEFQTAAEKCQTMEDWQKLFVENDVEILFEETAELISAIAVRKKQLDNGELSENDLNDVSGGVLVLSTVGLIALGVVSVGVFTISAFNSYNESRWKNDGTKTCPAKKAKKRK